jgi:two-component system chemotaxis response regulator CheY
MAAPKNGKRVLAIDDDRLARDVYRTLLEAAGFEVVSASEGNEGLNLFRKSKFDCVILDIFMPGMSGLDLIEELDPENSKVPIVAVSGASDHTGTNPLHLAITLGAARTLTKDFEHEDLVKAVKELTGVA